MSAYRTGRPQTKVAPKTPWWRILRAWLGMRGTFTKLARKRRGVGWAYIRNGEVCYHVRTRRFTDEEIDRHLPKSLRKTQSTGPR